MSGIADRVQTLICDNGLRVCVLPKNDTPTVTVQAWVRTGWVDEGKDLGCGLSHFLEHMLFHGHANTRTTGWPNKWHGWAVF